MPATPWAAPKAPRAVVRLIATLAAAAERQGRYADEPTQMKCSLLVAGLLLRCACASDGGEPPSQTIATKSFAVVGTTQDFKTRPGSYRGYEVTRCLDTSCVRVLGTGKKWPPGMDRESGHLDSGYEQSFQRFRADLSGALGAISSVDTSGFSRSCGTVADWWETVVQLHDWRELDRAVEAVGGFLDRRGLKEGVTFCVRFHSPGELE